MERLWRKAMALLDEFAIVNAETYASSIAYFAFLSLVPSLALCISLVSLAGVGEQEVVGFFAALVPNALEDLVTALIGDAFRSSGIAFSLSTVTLFWSASKGTKALRGGLNAVFDEQENRGALVVIAISILADLILGAAVAGMMYLIFSDSAVRFLARIAPHLEIPSGLLGAMNPIVLIAAGILIFDVCYAFLPAGTRRLRSQLPGAVLATIACGVLAFGFRLYVDQFGNYTILYGSIATVALLLMWMYFVSYILLIGGFINRMLEEGMLKLG